MFGLEPAILLQVFAIMLLAATVRGTLGFGDALLALPLLAGVVGTGVAVPAVAALAAGSGLAMGLTNWRSINWHGASALLIGAVVGLPAGVMALKYVQTDWLELVLGVLVIFVGVHGLWPRSGPTKWATPRNAPVFGLVAGVLGGMLGTSGPPVVLWSASTGWPPDRIRATLQGLFLPLSLLTVAGHLSAGLWSEPSVAVVVAGAPAILMGTTVGNYVAPKVPAERFQKSLFVALALLGLVLVWPG